MTNRHEVGRQELWRGRFLDLVDSLQIHLETSYGAKQYTSEQAIMASENDAVFYEIDETEGNRTGHEGIFGVITIHLTLFNNNLRAIDHRVVEIYSENSFSQEDANNRYHYAIDSKRLESELVPYIGKPDEPTDLR